MGESNFDHFMRLRNQPVIAAESFGREQLLSPIRLSRLSKDINEQLILADSVVYLVDRPIRKMGVSLPRYNVDNPQSSFAQVH